MTKLIQEDIRTYLNYNENVEGEMKFAVPNEIFGDLQSEFNYSKCAYAYSYYYLSMYLHFYAKYGCEESVDKFTSSNIQKILSLSPTSQIMNQITKRGGFLDKKGYTSTSTDYPVALLRLERVDNFLDIHHYMYSEEKKDFPCKFSHGKNFTVKHPDKMYWRTLEDKEDNYCNGTMYDTSNTHLVHLEMFLHALNIEEISYKGFYLYGFLRFKYDKTRGKGWTIPLDLFQKDIQLSKNTLKKLLKSLEEYNFIRVIRRKGIDGIDLPNIYIPNMNPKTIVYPK